MSATDRLSLAVAAVVKEIATDKDVTKKIAEYAVDFVMLATGFAVFKDTVPDLEGAYQMLKERHPEVMELLDEFVKVGTEEYKNAVGEGLFKL